MLENLPQEALPRLLRRTSIFAILVALIGFVVALSLGSALGALGVVIGVGAALLNFRQLDRQVSKVDVDDDTSPKALRKRLRGQTLIRLGAVTMVTLGALWLSFALGMGIVSGLVMYQIVFVANMFRLVASQGELL